MNEQQHIFHIQGKTINSTTYPDSVAIAKSLPSIPKSTDNDLHLQIDIRDDAIHNLLFQQPISISIPHQVRVSYDLAKRSYAEMQLVVQQLQSLQASIQTASHVVQGMMNKVYSTIAFAGLGSDIIAHIYSYCSSMPLDRLMFQGYKRYVNDIRQNYGLRRRRRSSSDKEEEKEPCCDSYKNMSIANFSLVCKSFAEALKKHVPLVIVRKTNHIPQSRMIQHYFSLDNVFLQLSKPLVNRLCAMSSNDKNKTLFTTRRLAVDCKNLTDQAERIVDLFHPRTLVLGNLKLFPMLEKLPDSVEHLVIEFSFSTYGLENTAAENLQAVLQNSNRLKKFTLHCDFATRGFLEALAKLRHLQVEMHVNRALLSKEEYYANIAYPKYFKVLIRQFDTSKSHYSDEVVKMEIEQEYLEKLEQQEARKERKRKYMAALNGDDDGDLPSAKRQRIVHVDSDNDDLWSLDSITSLQEFILS